ncbi:zinc finger CCCH domain-containing protein 17 [Ricinus communis]|uniref:zinc finger CCCH domain-containing protein 17 n=1 Tax=Ricinus communis TaxID=3988 RepID=UPI00201A5BCD|nr:zinc finger CCCH domain-containing protein 17 [Ricinus communis]XP_048233783.1 zinc finger CCCH domain-containing protein 17 [Ricinus communis]
MVAATQQQQQQQATASALSAEEEALKRNTDCVYFLASPLTCKKGSECEYRHSEYARVNPRDCYYWLNGSCLNPKCGFRHPPLDGLFGIQAATSAGPSLPQSQKVAAPAVHAPQNPGKQAVPCIFFQKGFCLKGDRCAFVHGPSPTSNKISQPVGPSAGTELPPQTKAYGGPQKLTQDQRTPQANFSRAVEASTEAKLASKSEIGSRRDVVGVERNLPPSKSMDVEVAKYKVTDLHPVVNGNSSRFNRLHQSQVPDDQNFQNGKDVDELLRESSPGFDVLVDDELRNSDFYHGEDQYGRTTGPEGRNLNPVGEYDRGHSADYNPVSEIDTETYRDLRGYDTYERMQGQYGWDQHKSSSDRMSLGLAHRERRAYSKADSPEHTDDADLRYCLSKHRRVDGLRSVVSHDFVPDNHVEERGYRSSSRRDSHSISSRFHGRIKLPGSSSNGSDLRVEREIDKGRSRGRLSPGRSQIPSHQGRLRDRIKGRVEEDYDSEGRSIRGNRMRREMTDDRNTDFAAPKSLAELKGTKSIEGVMQQSLRKRKQLGDHQPSEGDLSFEGPMPLSEILKRKRQAGVAASGSASSFNKHDDNQKESKEGLPGSPNNAAVTEIENGPSFVKNEANRQVLKDDDVPKSAIAVENTEVDLGQCSQLPNQSEPETEDGMIVDDGVEEEEYEVDDQGEGDYEYEQGDEGEYYEEGENAEGEEEYVDENEEFAKKLGVVFT